MSLELSILTRNGRCRNQLHAIIFYKHKSIGSALGVSTSNARSWKQRSGLPYETSKLAPDQIQSALFGNLGGNFLMPFQLSLFAWRSPFTVVSPLSLEECVVRLQNRDEPTRLIAFRSPLKIEVTTLGTNTFQFLMRRDSGRNIVVETVGVLDRHNSSTIVAGESRFERLTVITALITLGVLVPIITPRFGIQTAGFAIIFVLVGSALMIRSCRHLKAELFKLLEVSSQTNQDVVHTILKPQVVYRPTPRTRFRKLISIIVYVIFLVLIASVFLMH